LSNATGIPVGKITVNKQKLAPQEEEIVPMSERIKQFIDDYGSLHC